MTKKQISFVTMLLLSLCGNAQELAQYDFSAVCGSGQTLYYSVIGKGEVAIVAPYEWDYESEPPYDVVGDLDIPAEVNHDGTNYIVTMLAEDAFAGCQSLQNVTMPATIAEIEEWAFAYSGLRSIEVSPNVKFIRPECFYECENLESVSLPNALTGIYEKSFYGCSYLASIKLPPYLVSIGDYAFAECSSLAHVKATGRMCPRIGFYAFDEVSQDIVFELPCGLSDGYHYALSLFFNDEHFTEDCAEYVVSVDEDIVGGTVTVSTDLCTVGSLVRIEEHHQNDYHIVGYSVYMTESPEITLPVMEQDGIVFFFMPDYDVTVTAEFEYVPDGLDERVESLVLFPNPATKIVSVVNIGECIRYVRVINMLGATVMEYHDPQNNSFSVENLTEGVYIVNVVTDEGKQLYAKMVKK